MIMTYLRALGSFALACSVSSLVACGGDDPESRIDSVKSALSAPSGNVDAKSAKSVFTSFTTQTNMSGAFGPFAAAPGTGGSPDPSLDPDAQAACMSGDSSNFTLDMECASGGTMSGTISLQTDASAGGEKPSHITATYSNVCAKDVCFDGTMITEFSVRSDGFTLVADAEMDVTQGGTTEHAHWGLETVASSSESQIKFVIFDDSGESYVLESSSSGFTIEGANGSFACTVGGSADAGSCTGASSFSW
jgi:hypothetical protein